MNRIMNQELLPTSGIRAGLSAITPTAFLPITGILLASPLPDCSIVCQWSRMQCMRYSICLSLFSACMQYLTLIRTRFVFFCIAWRLLRLSILVTVYFLCHSIIFWRLPAWRLHPCLKAATCDCFEIFSIDFLQSALCWSLRLRWRLIMYACRCIYVILRVVAFKSERPPFAVLETLIFSA